MSYLDRNRALLDEVKQRLKLSRTLRGQGSKTLFYSAGKYESDILVESVYVGIKQPRYSGIWPLGPPWRAAAELSIILAIEREYPDMLSKCPVFLGLLNDKNDKPVGLVTEDFSKGGLHKVRDAAEVYTNPKLAIPEIRKLRKLIGNPNVNEDTLGADLIRACFVVNGGIKIGDFDTLPAFFGGEDFSRIRMQLDLEKELDAYSLHLDYDL